MSKRRVLALAAVMVAVTIIDLSPVDAMQPVARGIGNASCVPTQGRLHFTPPSGGTVLDFKLKAKLACTKGTTDIPGLSITSGKLAMSGSVGNPCSGFTFPSSGLNGDPAGSATGVIKWKAPGAKVASTLVASVRTDFLLNHEQADVLTFVVPDQQHAPGPPQPSSYGATAFLDANAGSYADAPFFLGFAVAAADPCVKRLRPRNLEVLPGQGSTLLIGPDPLS